MPRPCGPGKPAISPVRIPLIRVCSRPRRGAGGGPGPLADGDGIVLVVPQGAAGSVMAILPSRVDRSRWGPDLLVRPRGYGC